MQIETRSAILSTWLTLFIGTLSSSLVLNYYTNLRSGGDGLPQTFSQSIGLILGMALGGFLAGLLVGVLGGGVPTRVLLTSALMGYWLAALIRILFWGHFLPSGENRFAMLWEMVTFQSFPPYDAFLLWVLIGGSLTTVQGVLLMRSFRSVFGEGLPPIELSPRIVSGLLGLSSLLLLTSVTLRSLTDETPNQMIPAGSVQLTSVQWVFAPVPNMVIAAFLGFLVGGLYLCPDRWSASLSVGLAMMTHVMLMFLLDPILAEYDPLYDGVHPNAPNLAIFGLMWVGVPLMGMLAAFALHNLREAFALPEMTEA